STATNIVAGDANGALSDIYLWSRATQTAELVSRGTDTILGMPGVQPTDAGCDSPALSGSGVIVAFATATRSFDSDPGVARDVFLRDRQFRVTERVSFKFRASTALPKLEPNGDSFSPSISYDGALVAFASDATDLVSADSNGATDVFVYNRLAQTITRVSVSSTGEQAVGGDSHSPSISQDGRYVAFVSEAANLVSGDGNARADVFIHDLVTGATTRGSRTEAGAGINQDAEGPALSSGGQILAFSSEASNVVASDSNGESDVFTVIGPTIAP
ncbi:MAG: calcium-binding protein, partial [Candidatus Methylomirabilis sp.]|nr:calcium-binding protein [Deltaproteobacteria bacterium]